MELMSFYLKPADAEHEETELNKAGSLLMYAQGKLEDKRMLKLKTKAL